MLTDKPNVKYPRNETHLMHCLKSVTILLLMLFLLLFQYPIGVAKLTKRNNSDRLFPFRFEYMVI